MRACTIAAATLNSPTAPALSVSPCRTSRSPTRGHNRIGASFVEGDISGRSWSASGVFSRSVNFSCGDQAVSFELGF